MEHSVIHKKSLPATLLSFLFLFPAYAFASFAGGENPQDTVVKTGAVVQPVYTTSRLVTPRPAIDGKLDDECWKHGNWAGDYHQYIPNEGAKPTYPTVFNIQYDDKFIYIAFRAFDGEPEKIQRLAGGRDEFVGDMMGVNFDSYHDHRTGFEFTISAWGQKIDLILFNPENWDFNWNAVWKGKTGLEDSAWVAEIEVPLSQLRYSNEEEQVWGLHTWRWINRYMEESDWEYQSRTGPGVLFNFGELRGIKGLKKSQRLEIMPYALGELSTAKTQPGNPFATKGRTWGGNAGIDAKIGVSSNFTLDLTVNPDFGQVESDPSVMNLTAFETFYEEKRPFFLEGLTIFDYKFDEESLFYSRRIGHSPSVRLEPNDSMYVDSPDMTTILSAVKLSGTTSKGLSVGLIQSVTTDEFARLSGPDGKISTMKVEPLTNYMVGRLTKSYNGANTVIGGMITSVNRVIKESSLEFLANNAYTGGLDLRHHWRDKEFYIDGRLIGSYLNGTTQSMTALQQSSARYYQRPGADYLDYDTTRTTLNGYGGKFKIGKGSKGLWRYSTGVTWLSPGLELNDLGYMNSSDAINQENEVAYFVNKPVSIFRTYKLDLEQFNSWNFNGTYLGSGGHLAFTSEFTNQWSLGLNLIYHSSALDTKILRGGYDMMMPYSLFSFGEVHTDYSKKVAIGFDYSYEYKGNNSALSYELKPGITYRPFRTFKIGVTGNFIDNNDDLQYVASRNYNSEERYILGTIDQKTVGLTLRLNLNITPEFSIQYYGSPFISTGSYSEFKYVTNAVADAYDDRFALYNNVVLSDGRYLLDENDDMVADYSIPDPDFNFHEFRSNLVAKWEYRLGSFIYFVWSSERTGNSGSSHAALKESYKELRSIFPNNIFLIKLNYWFSL
ncbi:MAG: carbohydrate binding family 9 domain-containing protein [Bacteroidales bacterium]|nr:carbohydrate binding family 9 domain-containing protein [Bacteroidales bacterium]